MGESKARRILRRTAVGASLAGVLALALWWVEHSGNGLWVLGVGCVLSLLVVIEVGRMGSLAGRGLHWTLLAPWLLLLLTARAHVRHEGSWGAADAPLGTAVGERFLVGPAQQVLALLVVVVVAHGAVAGLRAGRLLPRLWGALLAAGLTAWFYLVFREDAAALHPERLGSSTAAGLLLGVALLVIVVSFATRRGGDLAVSAGLALWLLPALPWLFYVWETFGTAGLVSLIALAKVGDMAGYYVGNAFGRVHPFPAISPGKTVAGFAGSFVAAVALGGALVAAGVLPAGGLGIGGGLLAGAAINVAAQAGDLLESWVKRRAGVKDSGTWFGPSGGVLDLVDSLLPAVPVALLSWPRLFGGS